MRVGIDGLHLFGNYAGIQGSLARLVEGLHRVRPNDELVLYVPRDFKGPPAEDGAGLAIRRTWFPGRWRVVRTLWRDFRLQGCAYRDKCDVLHGPTYALPAALSKPAVVTIHDVIAFSHPLFCTPGSARVQKQIVPRSVKAARRIIVPSEATKEELLRNIRHAKPERIDVIPWGVGPEFKPIIQRDAARESLQLPKEYILFVGNLEPKKNIVMLIRAYNAARLNSKLPHKLVLAGQRGWGVRDLERAIRSEGVKDFVFFTGYIPQEALPAVYSLADLLVMPSLVEGFGMPVLEAMRCGCPVAISTDAALQEVAGGAARVVPYHPTKPLQPLRETIEELLVTHRGERDKLIERGLERAKLFTWEKTAQLTWETYERAMKE